MLSGRKWTVELVKIYDKYKGRSKHVLNNSTNTYYNIFLAAPIIFFLILILVQIYSERSCYAKFRYFFLKDNLFYIEITTSLPIIGEKSIIYITIKLNLFSFSLLNGKIFHQYKTIFVCDKTYE